jgi:hypothetical protein
MKKLLLALLILSFSSGCEVFAFSPTYSNPSESTMDFYPMMRRQMEHDVTLDFENKPEEYKEKRARKDAEAEYRAGNKHFNPSYGSSKGILNFRRNKNMKFSKDSNGNIIIKDSDSSED